jgi:hypothetical protein
MEIPVTEETRRPGDVGDVAGLHNPADLAGLMKVSRLLKVALTCQSQ